MEIESLDSLSEFAKILYAERKDLFTRPKEESLIEVENLYCSSPKCGGRRRARLDFEGSIPVDGLREALEKPGDPIGLLLEAIAPALFTVSCLQCDTKYTAVIYRRNDHPSLVILPSTGRGLATSYTPAGAAYYLDQAARSHSVGANSAAIAMFRSAVEWILEEEAITSVCLVPSWLHLRMTSRLAKLLPGLASLIPGYLAF